MKGLLNSRITEELKREDKWRLGPCPKSNPWYDKVRQDFMREAKAVPANWSSERRRKPSAMKFKAALLNNLSAKGQRHE